MFNPAKTERQRTKVKALKLVRSGNRQQAAVRMIAVVVAPVVQRMIERIVAVVFGLAFIPDNARNGDDIRQK